jgi:hypothetical protein
MEIDRTAFVGAGGLLIGAALAFAVGSSGRAALEAQLRQAGDVASTVAGLETTLGALDARLARVEGALAALEPASAAALEGLAGRIDGLGDELQGAVAGLGASVGERLSADIETLRAGLAQTAEPVAAAAPAAAGSGAPAPAAGPGAGEAVGIGATTSLAGGALRVFLSAADPAAGAARVAVNGLETTALALDAPVDVDGCRLTLTGFAPGGATLDAACDGGGTAAAPAAAAAGPGPGQELRIGAAAALGDGAVRVFLSGADPAAGTARAAINGVAVTSLALGQPVEAGPCAVTLTGFTPGGATVEAACEGAAAVEAAATDASTTDAAAAAAPALAPGETGLFGEGKLRVFVSAVDAAAGAARVAVNGTAVTALRQGEPAEIDGCTLTLIGAGPDGATLDATC